jgi:type IV pilus assembly protein PilB
MNKRKRIGTILLEGGYITAAQLKDALTDQVDSCKVLGEILVEKGIVSERQVTEALGLQLALPVVEIGRYLVESAPKAAQFLPRGLMEHQRIFPLELQDSGTLLVAIADPLDLAAEEELRSATHLKIKFALTTEREIYSALAMTVGKSVDPVTSSMKRPAEHAVVPDSRKTEIFPPFDVPTLIDDEEKQHDDPSFPREDEPLFNFLEGKKSTPQLGDVLVQNGVIDEEKLSEALQQQSLTGKRLGEILVAEGLITEIKLAEALAAQLKLPLFRLTRYHPMPDAVKLIPRHVAERLRLIPLSIVDDDFLLVAMADPLDLLAQDEVRMITGRELKLGVTTSAEIRDNLDRLYNLQNSIEDAIVEIKDAVSPVDYFAEAKANDAPVIQMVSNVLNQAVREEASDIHIEPCKHNTRVRYRVDGVLYTAFEYPSALHPSVSARVKIMAGMDISERRKPQDGRILIKTAGRSVDLRVSSSPTTRGEKMVLRILDQENSAVGLDRLGLEPDDRVKIQRLCGIPWGILLATGPTGSGKSTTLYSILEKINQPGINIVTIEDPVEYSMDGVTQIHVNEKAGVTFESALRFILRQDPDKIMVGEIRDLSTAQISIRAALTGHFVLSTLHTNDAPTALTRLVEMGVPPFLVAASLSGVIAQRLVRKLCPFCKQEYELDPYTCDALDVPRGSHAWKAKGCNECRQGYKGRRGIYEIMVVDDDLKKMILEEAGNPQLYAAAVERGMKTLRQSGINNALAGLTSMEEVFATTL